MKELYYLTDGVTYYAEAAMDSEEARAESKKAEMATDGNVWWTSRKPEFAPVLTMCR